MGDYVILWDDPGQPEHVNRPSRWQSWNMTTDAHGASDLEEVDPHNADLQGILGDNGYGEQDDMLDTSWSPPQRQPYVNFDHETLDQRLSEEQPEVWADESGDGIGDTSDTDGEPRDTEVGATRSGRLLAPDEGAHPDSESELWARDVGTDGGAASAEEAAMHIVDESVGFLD